MSVNRARALFIELVAQVPPEQWDHRLAELAGEDMDLRHKMTALLAAHGLADSFLERPASPPGGTIDESLAANAPAHQCVGRGASEGPGVVLSGRYQLVEEIGAGGMGAVWLAQQIQPVKRQVAI